MPESRINSVPNYGNKSGTGNERLGGGAQARLERSRQQNASNAVKLENGSDNFNNRKVIETGKKNITVKVQFDRSEQEQEQQQVRQEPEVLRQPQVQQAAPAPTPLVPSTPPWTPSDNSQWQPMTINQWDPQSQPQV